MNYITIPLSKRGKNRGKYEALVSPEDKELADLNWNIHIKPNTKYAKRNERMEDGKQKTIFLHREILERVLGHEIPDDMEVDHVDGDGLNNTRPNLRLATRSQNNMNRSVPRTNTSGYKGVCWHKREQKWQAQVRVNKKVIYLGLFDTPELAHQACCDARDKLHGDFASH